MYKEPINLLDLPHEISTSILEWLCRLSTKNDVLDHRLVCKAFDETLRPLTLRMLHLTVPKLMKHSNVGDYDYVNLDPVVSCCKALHIDLGAPWSEAFSPIVADSSSIEHELRTQYMPAITSITNMSLNSTTISALVFIQRMRLVVKHLSGIEGLKISLPYLYPSDDYSSDQINYLVKIIEVLARQPGWPLMPDRLIINNLGPNLFQDTFLYHRENAIFVLGRVRHVSISSPRESSERLRTYIGHDIWSLLKSTTSLWTLRLIGGGLCLGSVWVSGLAHSALKEFTWGQNHLKRIELVDIVIDAFELIDLCTRLASSLKALVLERVSLHGTGGHHEGDFPLWVGAKYADGEQPLSVARRLAECRKLSLDTVEVVDLNYQLPVHLPEFRFDMDVDPHIGTLDYRFKATVMRLDLSAATETLPDAGNVYVQAHEPVVIGAGCFSPLGPLSVLSNKIPRKSTILPMNIDDLFSDASILNGRALRELILSLNRTNMSAKRDIAARLKSTVVQESGVIIPGR